MIALKPHALGFVLAVRAQPGARKNAVLGERAGALRVAVSAAPEKGKANAAILAVLAGGLGCKASQVALLSGETSREKTFLVSGIDADDLRRRVDALAGLSTGSSEKETGDRRQETGGRDQKSDPPSFSAVKVPPDEGV